MSITEVPASQYCEAILFSKILTNAIEWVSNIKILNLKKLFTSNHQVDIIFINESDFR